MRLAQHLTALGAWYKQCLHGIIPGVPHCRDARVYGLTNAAIRDNEYPPPFDPPIYHNVPGDHVLPNSAGPCGEGGAEAYPAGAMPPELQATPRQGEGGAG